MKQHTKWFATAVAVASSLVIASSVQAQYVNGDATLDNLTLNAGNLPGAVSGPSGLTVTSPDDNYYWGQAALTPQTYNAGDNKVIWTYTINSPTPGTTGPQYPAAGAWSWTGITILLGSGTNNPERYPASGYDSPFLTYNQFVNGQGVANTDAGYSYNPATQQVTQVATLDANTLAQLGNINFVQFSIDSSESLYGGYSLTFNSIELVPEPATLALVGLGLAGLAIARRRNSVS